MQAASLFAFGHARGARIGIVALVSNSTDHTGEQFDTGEHAYRVQVFSAAVQAAHSFINDPSSGGDGAPASQTGHRGA
jgi:hypothetical protein